MILTKYPRSPLSKCLQEMATNRVRTYLTVTAAGISGLAIVNTIWPPTDETEDEKVDRITSSLVVAGVSGGAAVAIYFFKMDWEPDTTAILQHFSSVFRLRVTQREIMPVRFFRRRLNAGEDPTSQREILRQAGRVSSSIGGNSRHRAAFFFNIAGQILSRLSF